MKKLLTVVLFLSLGIFASAAFSLTADGNIYAPGSSIGLTTGSHAFSLHSNTPVLFETYLLILYPKTAAYFIQDLPYGIYPPEPWEDDTDFLYIDPILNPVPTDHIDFSVHFTGPAADFAVLGLDGIFQADPWRLVSPEPASLLLLALGGLALRMRKK